MCVCVLIVCVPDNKEHVYTPTVAVQSTIVVYV